MTYQEIEEEVIRKLKDPSLYNVSAKAVERARENRKNIPNKQYME